MFKNKIKHKVYTYNNEFVIIININNLINTFFIYKNIFNIFNNKYIRLNFIDNK